ncbi:MAG: ATP-binding protein, partial [Phycisphaerales bacterium]
VLLFRNVRELLINVVKHARANKIEVRVGSVDGQIQVSVEDDGVGFEPDQVTSVSSGTSGFGLFSIRQRLEELGGHIEIESRVGRGCRAVMRAPLKVEKAAEGA